MRYTRLGIRTSKTDPKGAPSPGTRLLIRAGFVDQLASGIWVMTDMGLRVRRLAESIVREEMERTGAVEVEMPLLHPAELWEETGRWAKYRKAGIAFHLADRKGARFILAPTAEEPMTDYARRNFTSYRSLPITLWQMSPKFRDELRPRQGLVRGREFLMKDAYSFDADEAGMRQSYKAMQEAYNRIFTRCGFQFIEVEADSGAIGGSGSAEFMAVSEFGEDTLIVCDQCGYGGNQEKASAHFNYPKEEMSPLERLETPEIKTVEQLEEFVDLPASKMVKTIVLVADGDPVIVSLRGDLEISEVKVANILGASEVATADPEMVQIVTSAPVGFAGPINLYGSTKVRYFFDLSVRGMRNFLCGGNERDVHYINVNPGRDFPEVQEFHDMSKASNGLSCARCQQGTLTERRGIELGHVFQLQQVYSVPMHAVFADSNGNQVPFWMGCYGVGVSRIVQASVEQHNDERGIIWPWTLAPFQVTVLPVNSTNLSTAEEIHSALEERGIRVMLDDRDLRIGEKFADAELLGWPIQVVVGRSWDKDGLLEVRLRDDSLGTHFPGKTFSSASGNLAGCQMSMEELGQGLSSINNLNTPKE